MRRPLGSQGGPGADAGMAPKSSRSAGRSEWPGSPPLAHEAACPAPRTAAPGHARLAGQGLEAADHHAAWPTGVFCC